MSFVKLGINIESVESVPFCPSLLSYQSFFFLCMSIELWKCVENLLQMSMIKDIKQVSYVCRWIPNIRGMAIIKRLIMYRGNRVLVRDRYSDWWRVTDPEIEGYDIRKWIRGCTNGIRIRTRIAWRDKRSVIICHSSNKWKCWMCLFWNKTLDIIITVPPNYGHLQVI